MNEMLSAKLRELDQRIVLLHGRIQASEEEGLEQIEDDIRIFKLECKENRDELLNKMKFSRAKKVEPVALAFEQIEEVIDRAKKEISIPSGMDDSEIAVEELILLAEYSIDFAMQAADSALLAAMNAAAAQMRQLEKEKMLDD